MRSRVLHALAPQGKGRGCTTTRTGPSWLPHCLLLTYQRLCQKMLPTPALNYNYHILMLSLWYFYNYRKLKANIYNENLSDKMFYWEKTNYGSCIRDAWTFFFQWTNPCNYSRDQTLSEKSFKLYSIHWSIPYYLRQLHTAEKQKLNLLSGFWK